jgi:hypothetical protein
MAKRVWSFNSLPIVSLSDMMLRHGGNLINRPDNKANKGRAYVDE